MHWLSIVIILFLLINAWSGWRKGLIRRALELVGLVASIFLALQLIDVASTWLFSMGLPAGAARVLGWLLIFGLGLVATRLIAWTVSKLIRATILGWLDKWGGALLGLFGGLVLGSILLMLATHSPGSGDLEKVIEENAVPRLVFAVAPAIYGLVADDDMDVKELWNQVKDRAEHIKDEAERIQDIGQQADDIRKAINNKLDDD